MNVLSLPKREFGLLAAHLPAVRREFESVMQARAKTRTLRMSEPERLRREIS
jgi:hypothetical protein